MIRFENVNLKLKERTVLSNVSFEIRDNSTVCFVANRTKSDAAILKLIAGVYKNYDGNIFIDDINIKKNYKVKTSMLFSVPEIDNDMTVYEYLRFYADIIGMDKVECDNYINLNLKKMEIMSYKYTLLSDLGRNILIIVGIIRAMLKNPNILLIDGIFLENDYNFNYMLLKHIKKLVGNRIIVFDNTKLDYVDDICTDIGIVVDDNLLIYGDKDDIYKKATMNKRIEIIVHDDIKSAVDLLNEYDEIENISFDNNRIVFSIKNDELTQDIVLKKLVNNGIKIYSYKNENINKEQLIEAIMQKE